MMIAGAGGCQQEYAAASNQALTDAEEEQVRVLSQQQQQQVGQVFEQLAGGYTPDPALDFTAPERGRWSDVYIAVEAALAELDINGAIRSAQQYDEGWRFEILLADNRPGFMLVRRRPPPEVYEVDAELGNLGDLEEKERRLISHFERYMAEFGRKRQPLPTSQKPKVLAE